ncbi:MAG: Fic family protein [Bacteroidota bacterium]|nr:Fic family protein [Bacteroidota bacterium]
MKKRPVLSTNLFIKLVQIIKENTSGIRNAPGTQLKNPATGKIVYTPPEGESIIREKLKNLEDFIHSGDDIDPLIKMAIIHYQFEAIHPFFDGNGRTGRIIILLYLKLNALLDLPALYLSSYINNNKNEYYRKLRAVTEKNAWQEFILFMLEMLERAARKDRKRIAKIDKLMGDMRAEIKKQLPRVYSKDLMEILFRLPYTKIQFLERAGLGNQKTVGNYLREMEKAGFLTSEKVGKEKLYLNYLLMEILKQ